jgi:hypothetical protein
MNIEVAKSDLEDALKVASTTVGSGTDLSSHYLFRLRGEKAEVLSYDMRVFSGAPFTAKVEGDDGEAFTVEAWRLDKWIASVGNGVLTLATGESGEVIAKGPRSKIKLRSLDPTRFPFWDGLLDNSESMGEVEADVLRRALSLSKTFVSTDDTNRPELCQVESVGGTMQATNRRAVSSVKVRAIPGLSLRIPGKDIGTVLKFLGDRNTQENPVDVKEARRDGDAPSGVIFYRPDGSYVGVSRPTSPMPKLPIEAEESDVSLTLDVEEFMGGVAVLQASAKKDKAGVVSFASKDGSLVISMPSDAGGVDEYPLITSTEDGLGEVTFSLDHSYIKSLADQFDLDSIRLGVHQRGRGGYVSFLHDEGSDDDGVGNQYHTVIVWHS